MKFTVSTKILLEPRQALEKFDAPLFTALAPPFPKVRLVRFSESAVEIALDFLVYKTVWASKVFPAQFEENQAFFVDEGVRLPPPLKFWRHTHRLVARPGGALLRDEIEFSTGYRPLDLLVFPFLWAMMAYRKPIYRKRLR